MNKLPKYMMITHPLIAGEFIIRTQQPIIVGKIVRGDIEQMIKDQQPVAFGKPLGQNRWAVFFVGKLDKAPMTGTAEEQTRQLDKIMSRMSDFYLHIVNKP